MPVEQSMMRFPQRRKRFSVLRSARELESYMPELPDDTVYKFISTGGFSSVSFICYVAERAKIHRMYASSFRVGKKELQMIYALAQEGRIEDCYFAVGTLMANAGTQTGRYHYYENFRERCDERGWKYVTVNNHSKLILFDTEAGKFVLETSSNLNENPKVEQFSFEKSAELFAFYASVFAGWEDGEREVCGVADRGGAAEA